MIFEDDYNCLAQHTDACEHPADSFVGSRMVRCEEFDWLRKWVDVYIFQDKYGARVCLRLSDAPEDYISPGSLEMFLTMANTNEIYRQCLELMTHLGDITWAPKKEKEASKLLSTFMPSD